MMDGMSARYALFAAVVACAACDSSGETGSPTGATGGVGGSPTGGTGGSAATGGTGGGEGGGTPTGGAGGGSCPLPDPDDHTQGVLNQALPGCWRPFHDDSAWNQPIPTGAPSHPDSDTVVATLEQEASNVRFGASFVPPVWVINSAFVSQHQWLSSGYIYYESHTTPPFVVDGDPRDGITDDPWPASAQLWGENTSDGHITLVDLHDPAAPIAIEASSYFWDAGATYPPNCTTFNIWDLLGEGVAYPPANIPGRGAVGGRGAGFPVIAGLLRPEEVEEDEINHALVFTFNRNRTDTYLSPPAARSDGAAGVGTELPVEGMLLQLDPAFDVMSLGSVYAQRVARALQEYGMYDGDNGGAMAISVQALAPDPTDHRNAWEARAPGMYDDILNIPVSAFRVIDTTQTLGAQLLTD